jgi:hypothetical protein
MAVAVAVRGNLGLQLEKMKSWFTSAISGGQGIPELLGKPLLKMRDSWLQNGSRQIIRRQVNQVGNVILQTPHLLCEICRLLPTVVYQLTSVFPHIIEGKDSPRRLPGGLGFPTLRDFLCRTAGFT